VEILQKASGIRSSGDNSFRGTVFAVGLKVPELCAFSCPCALEIHWHGKVFWSVSFETIPKFSRDCKGLTLK
jgi:hypothetical protein